MQHRRGTLTESVLDTELLLDNLQKYQETITTMKNLFTLLDNLLLTVGLDEVIRLAEDFENNHSNKSSPKKSIAAIINIKYILSIK
jgi:hypothetical protein